MNYTQAFQTVNLIALLTWLFIIFLPNMKYTRRIVFGFTIFLLSVVYA
ncbi:MAG: abscisic acid-deficient protein Aba4 family protein, partial [Bacteroidota bacterium]